MFFPHVSIFPDFGPFQSSYSCTMQHPHATFERMHGGPFCPTAEQQEKHYVFGPLLGERFEAA